MNQNSRTIEKFLRYVKVDTQSDYDGKNIPTTEKQKDLARLLVSELKELGASDVCTDEHGYVYASIPSNVGRKVPAVAFIAHMDTSPAVSGANVNPRILHYEGGNITLNEEKRIVLSPEEFPELAKYEGHDLIVTDGTTLLGADDKAGVAEIMELAELLLSDPSIPHGDVKIAFTPDEEVGHGTDFFDVEGLGAEVAYTVDGGAIGEIGYETFNAAALTLTIHGKSTHTGGAKGKMVNSMLLLMEFHSMLPVFDNPIYTEGREGFFHLDRARGDVAETVADYIIRDHDRAKFEERKERIRKIVAYLNERYGEGTFDAKIEDTYYNMREVIEQHWDLIENAEAAMRAIGVEPFSTEAARGGTDGSRLSFMGLPCPNLCTGGHNCHGIYEFASVQEMEQCVQLLVNIAKLYAEK